MIVGKTLDVVYETSPYFPENMSLNIISKKQQMGKFYIVFKLY